MAKKSKHRVELKFDDQVYPVFLTNDHLMAFASLLLMSGEEQRRYIDKPFTTFKQVRSRILREWPELAEKHSPEEADQLYEKEWADNIGRYISNIGVRDILATKLREICPDCPKSIVAIKNGDNPAAINMDVEAMFQDVLLPILRTSLTMDGEAVDESPQVPEESSLEPVQKTVETVEVEAKPTPVPTPQPAAAGQGFGKSGASYIQPPIQVERQQVQHSARSEVAQMTDNEAQLMLAELQAKLAPAPAQPQE